MLQLLFSAWSDCLKAADTVAVKGSLGSLCFPTQARERAVTQCARHWWATGTHRNLHEPHKEYTCTPGITHLPHKLCIKSLPKCRADLTSQQFTLHTCQICLMSSLYFTYSVDKSIPKNTLLPEEFLAQTEMMHEYHHIVLYFEKSNRTALCYTVLKILINKH